MSDEHQIEVRSFRRLGFESKYLIRTSVQSAVKGRYPEDRMLAGIRVARREFQDRANLAKLPKYHGSKDQRAVDAWIDTWLSPEFAVWILNESLAAIRYPMQPFMEIGMSTGPLSIPGASRRVASLLGLLPR